MAEHLSALTKVDEALIEIRRALELDPLSSIMNKIYADIYADARRYDEAIEQYKKTIEFDPNFAINYYFLARAYEAKGMYDQACDAYGTFARFGSMRPEDIDRSTEIYKKSGWKAYLQEGITQLRPGAEQGKVPAFVMSTFYGRVGDKDETMKWLQKAFDERDFRVTMIGVSFEFDSVRTDPRFIELVRRVGLTQ